MKKWSIFLLSMLLVMSHVDGRASDFENIAKLTARGEASIFKPSDQMEVNLGVLTSAEKSSAAVNENNQRMSQVIAQLQALGLDESDYQTGRFSIRPLYEKNTKNSYQNEGKIKAYEVVNTLQVKTAKIELADKIIDAAVQAGANRVDEVNFTLVNPQAYRAEAIQAAAKNAFNDALVLANATGVKIKRVLSLSLDHWHQYPAPYRLAKGVNESSSAPDVFEPGRSEIHATVNVVYELAQD